MSDSHQHNKTAKSLTERNRLRLIAVEVQIERELSPKETESLTDLLNKFTEVDERMDRAMAKARAAQANLWKSRGPFDGLHGPVNQNDAYQVTVLLSALLALGIIVCLRLCLR